jgi:hypothetical protein
MLRVRQRLGAHPLPPQGRGRDDRDRARPLWRIRADKAAQLDEYHDVQHVVSFLTKVAP